MRRISRLFRSSAVMASGTSPGTVIKVRMTVSRNEKENRVRWAFRYRTSGLELRWFCFFYSSVLQLRQGWPHRQVRLAFRYLSFTVETFFVVQCSRTFSRPRFQGLSGAEQDVLHLRKVGPREPRLPDGRTPLSPGEQGKRSRIEMKPPLLFFESPAPVLSQLEESQPFAIMISL